MIRWTIVALVFGLLVSGVLFDRIDQAPAPAALPVPAAVVSPSLVEPARLSDVWFCPVGSGSVDGYAAHQLDITNLGDRTAVANIDLMTGTGPGSGLRVEVEPLSTETVDLPSLDQAPLLGATVEIVNGQGVVGHSVTTIQGVVQGPCSTSTSSSWFFADGVTTRDSTEYLALLNPFAEDVVFRVTFQTSGRTREPEDLEAAVVPGRSVRVIDVGQYVSRESHVATTIETVKGQLAVERLQLTNGDLGPRGASLQLGVMAPALSWTLPAGRVHDGGDQRLVVYNPGEVLAEVDIEFDLSPVDRASYGLVPVEAVVQPGRFAVVDLKETLSQSGLPLPYEFGVRVVSANAVPVVVERWQITPPIDSSLIGAGGNDARIVGSPSLPGRLGRSIGLGAGLTAHWLRQTDADPDEVPEEEAPGSLDPAVGLIQPTATMGSATSRGVEVMSNRWVVAWLPLLGDNTAIVVSGQEGTAVEVSVVVAGELLPAGRAVVPAAGWISIPVSASVAAAPVIIQADQPVVAEAMVVEPDVRLAVIPAIPVLTP